MKLGNSDINDCRLGSTKIREVRRGTVKIWPDIMTVACNEDFSYSGSAGDYTFEIDFGTGIGTAGLKYDAMSVPDNFTISWNGQTYTSGFVGSSSYRQQLLDMGVPESDINLPLSGSNGSGFLLFEKDSALPTKATITVAAPLDGTAWDVIGACPGAGPYIINDLSIEINSSGKLQVDWDVEGGSTTNGIALSIFSIGNESTGETPTVLDNQPISSGQGSYVDQGVITEDVYVAQLMATDPVFGSSVKLAALVINMIFDAVEVTLEASNSTSSVILWKVPTDTVTIVSSASWLHVATSTSEFLEIPPEVYQIVEITADDNTGAQRVGTITATNQDNNTVTVTVTQSAPN